MKKILSLFAMAAVVLSMASCGDGNEPVDETKVNPNSDGYGLMPGAFSIGNGRVAYFSQGNLQYRTSWGTWRFAANQWDAVGKDQSNWRDLFGWSTGEEPMQSSSNYLDYTKPFKDWGKNVIANGGVNTEYWRTLSQAEWEYLFTKRNNAAKKFGLGKVAGMNGVIILPDVWDAPAGAPALQPSAELGMNQSDWLFFDGDHNNHFADNTYSKEQWNEMEKAGAIFLPAAGQRDASASLEGWYIGEFGIYWSSDDSSTSDAYCVYFQNFQLDLKMEEQRPMGFSVRLVHVVVPR